MKAARRDAVWNVVLVLVAVVTAATLLLAFLGAPKLIDTQRSVEASQRSDQIAGCRSEYSADVTSAQQALDDADSAVDDAESRRNDLIFLGLVATATDSSLQPLVEQSGPVSSAIADARADRQEARIERDRVTDRRDESVTLSRRDPGAFLARCRRDFG